jgi:hypothetical protein
MPAGSIWRCHCWTPIRRASLRESCRASLQATQGPALFKAFMTSAVKPMTSAGDSRDDLIVRYYVPSAFLSRAGAALQTHQSFPGLE